MDKECEGVRGDGWNRDTPELTEECGEFCVGSRTGKVIMMMTTTNTSKYEHKVILYARL